MQIVLKGGGVYVGGDYVKLTRIEEKIFLFLAVRRGQWVSKDTIFDGVWGDDEDGGPLWVWSALGVHIHHIRKKLPPYTIDSRRAQGYRITKEGELQ